MPRLPSREDGRIARWLVAEGESVAPGDVIAEIATTTATLEIEAAYEGRMDKILVPAGSSAVEMTYRLEWSELPVGSLLWLTPMSTDEVSISGLAKAVKIQRPPAASY